MLTHYRTSIPFSQPSPVSFWSPWECLKCAYERNSYVHCSPVFSWFDIIANPTLARFLLVPSLGYFLVLFHCSSFSLLPLQAFNSMKNQFRWIDVQWHQMSTGSSRRPDASSQLRLSQFPCCVQNWNKNLYMQVCVKVI